MTTNQQEKIIEPTTGLISNFLKFEKDKRLFVKFTNWRTVETPKEVEQDGMKKTVLMAEFRADVVQYGDKKEIMTQCLPPKLLALTNKKFRAKINDVVETKNKSDIVFVSLKRMNEGKLTDYDVEVV